MTSTPSFSSSAWAFSPELGAEGRQHLRGGVDEHDAGGAGVDRAEVLVERAVRELGDLAGHLHAGRAGADDHEGQQVVDVVAAGRPELGHLEGAEDPAAQLEGVVDALHAGGELGEVVVAEVGLAGAGGDQQRVVRRHGLATEDLRGDGAGLEVDVGDLAEQDAGVVLPAEHLAGRRGDLALGEDAGRDLVEQRLEEVVGGLGDHRDVDVGTPQRLGAEQSAEPGADHDHLVAGCLRRGHGSSWGRRCSHVGHHCPTAGRARRETPGASGCSHPLPRRREKLWCCRGLNHPTVG